MYFEYNVMELRDLQCTWGRERGVGVKSCLVREQVVVEVADLAPQRERYLLFLEILALCHGQATHGYTSSGIHRPGP